ncbi:MAG: ABC transporter permease [Acidobacteria bacterium]|nr:ABC transporter permease [Acidobacteriota bacterium]
MTRLIAANFTHHLGRTIASIFGVALGVVLVVLTVGLVRGQLRDRGTRDANLGFEIILSLQGQKGLSVTSLPLTMPAKLAEDVRRVSGVAAAVPVGQQLEMKGETGLGIRQIDGVEFQLLAAISKLHIVTGQPLPDDGDFIVVDVRYAAEHQTKIGEKIAALGRDFTVAGTYEPETGARMMIPLKTMQVILNAPQQCSMLYVKCHNAEEQMVVAERIATAFPEMRILLTKDLPELFAYGYQGFNMFLNVVAVLAAFVSMLVILLTMYTSVTERTRQIGILKALGASRKFIALVFVNEALLVSGVGVFGGLGIALLARWVLVWNGMRIALEFDFIGYAILVGLLSGLMGALYPALRAAQQDPIDALSYE